MMGLGLQMPHIAEIFRIWNDRTIQCGDTWMYGEHGRVVNKKSRSVRSGIWYVVQ